MIPFSPQASNLNLLWASLFIEELVRHGITDFCIAPGSRSTPLTLAAATHQQVNTHVHFDERGLGFLALGLSQASQKPVVIITTSGTAVANLYPAIIEARQSGVPLIVISADRPPELINCGANQAIEQHNIFARYPVFFAQIASPSVAIKANYLLTTIDQGLNKQKNHPAPIHFNIAFTEPFYPTEQIIDYSDYLSSLKNWNNNGQPFTQVIKNQALPLITATSLADKKVLIIVGKMKNIGESRAIIAFAEQKNYPLFADIQSSQSAASSNLSYYDLLLVNTDFRQQLQQADLIIQFGEQLVSKRLLQFIEAFNGELYLVKQGEERIDPTHQLDKRFDCSARQWRDAHINQPAIAMDWLRSLQTYQHNLSAMIDDFISAQNLSEISVLSCLDKLLPKGKPLFIGNSMPIRLADMLMVHNNAHIFTNRGASGIDGIIATAIGVAKKASRATTLLIGDTSFLYDLNSLALLKQLDSTFIIIVINNDGGAIFNLLPVPDKQKQTYYQLPHGLNFKSVCDQFCIDYYHPNQLIEFEDIYNRCQQAKLSLIEITTTNQQTATQLAHLTERIKDATL